jgi:rRNA processing protein Krr1/Pno1
MSGDPTLEAVEVEPAEDNVPDPAARVLGWRIEQLIAVGFDSDAALVLALDRTVDLHDATELVRRGCPPQTAFRILI